MILVKDILEFMPTFLYVSKISIIEGIVVRITEVFLGEK